MSHSWAVTVTGGYFSVGSNDLLQNIRYIAKDADDAAAGLDYGLLKVMELMKCKHIILLMSVIQKGICPKSSWIFVVVFLVNMRLLFAPYGFICAWKFREIHLMQNDCNVVTGSVCSQWVTKELFCRKLIPKQRVLWEGSSTISSVSQNRLFLFSGYSHPCPSPQLIKLVVNVHQNKPV